jgi:hypothetical protein
VVKWGRAKSEDGEDREDRDILYNSCQAKN